MGKMIIETAKSFLTQYSSKRKFSSQRIHPWRKNNEHFILHSLRINTYANKIMRIEASQLSDEGKILIKVSTYLHDIGKFDNADNHAEITEKWLLEITHLG